MEHPFHKFPVHLYHATKDPIVAHDSETEANARNDGYQDTYIPREYPKHLTMPDGSTLVVKSADEEARALSSQD